MFSPKIDFIKLVRAFDTSLGLLEGKMLYEELEQESGIEQYITNTIIPTIKGQIKELQNIFGTVESSRMLDTATRAGFYRMIKEREIERTQILAQTYEYQYNFVKGNQS